MKLKTLLTAVIAFTMTAFSSAEDDVVIPDAEIDDSGVCHITNADNLQWLNRNWDNYVGSLSGISLDADVELPEYFNWVSNIDLNVPFHGNNHYIYFYSKDENDSQLATGLFRIIINNGSVDNLTLNAQIEASSIQEDYIGILANYVEGGHVVGTEGETFNTPLISNVVTNGKLSSSRSAVAGLVGCANGSYSFVGCTNRAEVSASSSQYAGGIVGRIFISDDFDNNQVEIVKCSNFGLISHICSYDNSAVGGIVGCVDDPTEEKSAQVSIAIQDCFNVAKIHATNRSGKDGYYYSTILGYSNRKVSVSNCFANLIDHSFIYQANTPDGQPESVQAPLYRDATNLEGVSDSPEYALYSIYDISSDAYPMLTTGKLVYVLNGNVDSPKDPTWFQGPDYPVLTLGEDCYTVNFKHGDIYNNTKHSFDTNGFCSESTHCYQTVHTSYNQFYVQNVGQFFFLNENWGTGIYLTNSQVNLSKDLDLTPYEWVPNIDFGGSWSGQGHTVKFKQIINSEDTPVGLFKSVSDCASLTNTIFDVDIRVAEGFTGTIDNVGAVSGVSGVVTSSSHKVNFYKVFLKGTIDVPCATSVGGLFGSYIGMELDINGVVSDIDITGGTYVGGLIGNIENKTSISSDLYFKESANRGNLSLAEGSNGFIGGLIGNVSDNLMRYLDLRSCGNTGGISAYGASSYGSVIGRLGKELKSFENCYAYFEGDNELNVPDNIISYVGGLELSEDVLKGCHTYIEGVSSEDDKHPFVSGLITNEAERLAGITVGQIGNFYYRQNLSGENADKYPVVLIEKGYSSTDFIVFKTCNDRIFTNENLWEDNVGYQQQWSDTGVFKHQYDDGPYHVCIFCGLPDKEYWENHKEVAVEEQEDLTNLVDNVSALTDLQIPVEITIENDITYDDEIYDDLSTENVAILEETLPAKASIGTTEKPFIGTMDGKGMEIVNFAFKQNALFGQIGKPESDDPKAEWSSEDNKKIEIKDFSISNGVVFSNLESSEKEVDAQTGEETIFAAALANVNYGVLENCSFVGALEVPDSKVANAMRCLVGVNYGTVSHCFAYFTDIDKVKELNKAAILVKGNAGIGRSGAGQSKKVAANTASNYSVDDDSYYTPDEDELKKAERLFSNAEFASGVVAYWLNFEGNDIDGDYGYTGNYTCKYSQGLLTPVLANADGSNALHRIRYNKNNGEATVTGTKAYANSGNELNLIFSEDVASVKVNGVNATKVSDRNYKVTVPVTSEADVVVDINFKNGSATGLVSATPDKVNVMVVDGQLRIFGAEGNMVRIYNLNGAQVYASEITSDRIDLPALGNGIFFVKVGNSTSKIIL